MNKLLVIRPLCYPYVSVFCSEINQFKFALDVGIPRWHSNWALDMGLDRLGSWVLGEIYDHKKRSS